MNEPEIVVFADPEAGAIDAAARIATILADAVEVRARADWATTGGSTPVGIYRRLVEPPLVDALPWGAVEVWWGDDRYVPRDHPQSNVKGFDDVVLDFGFVEEGTAGVDHPGVHMPIEHIHPFPTGEAIGQGAGAAWCAATYAKELRAAGLDERNGWPVFDLILLGIGPDGHLLSVFPGSPALVATELAMAIPAPTHVEPHIERVTLNPAVIDVARNVIVVVFGSDKAATLADVLGNDRDPSRWPGQLAVRPGVAWILDEAAAAGLPGH